MEAIQHEALVEFREKNTHLAKNYAELKSIVEVGGFVRCSWDGDALSEQAIKKDTKATIRCILTDESVVGKKCVYSGMPAKHEVIIARAY